MAREIRLGKSGMVALVDDSDFERVSQFKWYPAKSRSTFYALTSTKIDGKRIDFLLHRFLLGLKRGDPMTDHIDGDGLNCQKFNLRLATNGQNQWNRRKNKNATSQFKGVSYHSARNNWQARIQANGVERFLGCFVTEVDAAVAYDMAARHSFGEFARTNFPVVNESAA